MLTKKKFAVILSGNGVFDGSEIHEATLTLYSIAISGCTYEIFAPDIDQHHVINHITGEEMNEKRNVLIESARIARGNIKSLSEYNADNFDALIFPGGFGVAKNLCSYAFDGIDCKVNPEVEKVIKSTFVKNIPIGGLCISPVLLARVLGDISITIGQDKETSEAITKLGAKHETTNHGEVIVDRKNKIITTPCYMLDANISQIGEGAQNIVNAIIDLIS
ncbi:MAG: isoprenoid biosynthesis glyoxalase ElbB [Bacteroidales bacterium]|jgi:enhancing lycopene biosynthesis protein 2|nr:isoprenoid biosynthesis glyoxalase ElbB [Bacteroidales bacterium]